MITMIDIKEYLSIKNDYVQLLWVVRGVENTAITSLSCWSTQQKGKLILRIVQIIDDEEAFFWVTEQGDGPEGTSLGVSLPN